MWKGEEVEWMWTADEWKAWSGSQSETDSRQQRCVPQRPMAKNLAKHPVPNRNPASMTARECAIRKKKDKHIAAENRRRLRKALLSVNETKATFAKRKKESDDVIKRLQETIDRGTLKAQST